MQTTTLKTEEGGLPAQMRKHSYDMIVFCHLRWDFVYQRPQHIISRMAKKYKILFIEEPWRRQTEKQSRLLRIHENLHVLQPNVETIEDIIRIVPDYVDNTTVEIGWFYSPSFVPLLTCFDFSTIVYDCMDELSLFKGAPAELIEHERYLVANADVVFTGGKSLYETKARLHSNVHCYPSSVDQAHFEKALNGIALPDDIATIPAPIVGYFGVIDERLDLALLQDIAKLRPDVSFVMIGPLAKIEAHELPVAPNIHYLGMKDYEQLPNYIKAFDLAMMPFALNDATKFISPTKTLEYMAAHKPIASTAIKDVVRDYSHCVSVIHNVDDFDKAIADATDEIPDPFLNYEYKLILQKTSWDSTVLSMMEQIKAIAQ